MHGESTDTKSSRRTLVLVFVLALAVRAAAVTAFFGALDADPDSYRKLAENVRLQGIYTTTNEPTAFRPPLYPLILALTVTSGEVSSLIVAGLHVVFGAGTVLLTFLLAEACGLRRGAFLAAGLIAIDPILLNQSALVMTETLATLLAAAGMLALARVSRMPTNSNAALAGAILGLAALCRPTFLPWLGLAGATLLSPRCQADSEDADVRHPRRSLQLSAVYFVVAALVVSPWAIRNFVVLGHPKVTTTHGGYTVLLGNNPSFYQYLRESKRGETWDATPLASAWRWRQVSNSPRDEIWDLLQTEANKKSWRDAGYDEAIFETDTPIVRSEFEDDAFAYSLARRYIRDEPAMFAYACGVRVARLWQLFPYPRGASESTTARALRVLTGLWYTVLFLLAAYGAVSQREKLGRSPLVWGVVLCITFTVVHAVYWSNMRMRAPLMPMVCLLASLGTAAITERLHTRKL
jgi:4-amino-4-deoxy-L-arabinose transferase-like glycosyltransferase